MSSQDLQNCQHIPDVAPAFQIIHEAGIRIIALTNGSDDNTRTLLQRAGLIGVVERIISIHEIRRWKPGREVYLHAVKAINVEPEQMALVAAHAWDVHGASRAGLVKQQSARTPGGAGARQRGGATQGVNGGGRREPMAARLRSGLTPRRGQSSSAIG